MNVKIISRVLTPAIWIFYIIVGCLIILTAETKTVLDIWGGFTPTGGMALNILGIMQWNICIMPPVVACNLFMIAEIGQLSIFTMAREHSVQKWYFKRYAAAVLSVFAYIAFVLLITTAFGFNRSLQLEQLVRFVLCFSMHSVLLVSASIAVLIIYKSSKAALLLYLTIEGIMVIVGSAYPVISNYLFPFWGMAKNNGNAFLIVKMLISFLLIILIVIATSNYLGRNNPAETPQNI